MHHTTTNVQVLQLSTNSWAPIHWDNSCLKSSHQKKAIMMKWNIVLHIVPPVCKQFCQILCWMSLTVIQFSGLLKQVGKRMRPWMWHSTDVFPSAIWASTLGETDHVSHSINVIWGHVRWPQGQQNLFWIKTSFVLTGYCTVDILNLTKTFQSNGVTHTSTWEITIYDQKIKRVKNN